MITYDSKQDKIQIDYLGDGNIPSAKRRTPEEMLNNKIKNMTPEEKQDLKNYVAKRNAILKADMERMMKKLDEYDKTGNYQ